MAEVFDVTIGQLADWLHAERVYDLGGDYVPAVGDYVLISYGMLWGFDFDGGVPSLHKREYRDSKRKMCESADRCNAINLEVLADGDTVISRSFEVWHVVADAIVG